MFDSIRRRARGIPRAVAVLAIVAPSLPAAAATTSCNIPQACALFTNANGPGVSGTSAKSEGVVGTTTFSATSTSNRTFGIEGIDGSTNKNAYNFGVYGSSPYGTGVAGSSPNGQAVNGTSTSGVGVRAASSSGIALNASSSSNRAVSATSGSNSAIVGTTSATNTSTTHAGLMGIDGSTKTGVYNDGVLGTTKNGGYGVEGTSGDNAAGGVRGLATNGVGVTGQSDKSIGTYGYGPGFAGVYGSGSTTGIGVYGSGYNSPGVQGNSNSSYGLYGTSVSGTALGLTSSTGYGLDILTGTGGGSNGLGIRVNTSNGNGADVTGSYIGLVGRSDTYPLVLTNTAGTDLFYVDGSGNIFAHGTYNTFVATHNGAATTAFTARSTTPSVEDAGTARLVGGIATVRFDAAFAASIDAGAVYQVFLTPGGDTRGLYVASKTPTGFVVRETQGGRGTLAFDYRILATAPGRAHERMALVSPAATMPKAVPGTHAMKAMPALADPSSHMATRTR